MNPITLVLSLACLAASTLTAGETVVLQQGVSPKGYAGCQTATLWPAPPSQSPASGDRMLYLRGEQNRLLARFEIPAAYKGKSLVRARLWVFLPKVMKENRYCEIMCNGMLAAWDKTATWANAGGSNKWQSAGGHFDNRTAYSNGRPLGVTDSYELYAKDHPYWNNLMRWLPVSVPEGGMWIAFNVTPLAEKWLATPAENFGVMLMPVRIEDRRMPNPWEIDIPSETYDPDPKLRPRLEMEFTPAAEPVQVGMIHSMIRVNPWSSRYMYRGEYKREYALEMAANEYEGFQVIVHPLVNDVKDIRFAWDDLVEPATGRKLPKDRLNWYCEDVIKLNTSWLVRDAYFGGKRYHVPDPLVPADLAPARWRDVPRQQATPFWFTVHAPAGTAPGLYRATLTLSGQGMDPVKLALGVRVWDYEIPRKWNFSVVGSFGDPSGFYGSDWRPDWMDRWYDFLLDHRLAPVAQYSSVLSPPVERIPHCVERGMNVIYLDGHFRPQSDLAVLQSRHDKIKQMGLIDLAAVYVEDEGQQHEMRRQLAAKRRQHAPEAMMLVGGAPPVKEMIGVVDIWDPEIDQWPGDKLSAAEGRRIVEECQARGEQFYWYVAAAPTHPYPNIQLEYPLIAARSYLWMTWKYRVTGFEYYCYNIWARNIHNPPRWPDAPWDPRSFKEYNSDGNLFYPGPNGTPCSSVRLENIRDGIEDWESFYLLRDYADALRAKKDAKAADILKRADAMLDVPDEVVTSVTKWSQDPELLLKTRRDLADFIVALKGAVPQAEYEKTRDARRSLHVERQRKMLRERASPGP